MIIPPKRPQLHSGCCLTLNFLAHYLRRGMARTYSHVSRTRTTAPSSLSTADWNGSQLAGREKGSMGGIIMFSGWEGRVEHTHREFVCRAVRSVRAQMHCGEHLAYRKVIYCSLLHHWIESREGRPQDGTAGRRLTPTCLKGISWIKLNQQYLCYYVDYHKINFHVSAVFSKKQKSGLQQTTFRWIRPICKH